MKIFLLSLLLVVGCTQQPLAFNRDDTGKQLCFYFGGLDRIISTEYSYKFHLREHSVNDSIYVKCKDGSYVGRDVSN